MRADVGEHTVDLASQPGVQYARCHAFRETRRKEDAHAEF